MIRLKQKEIIDQYKTNWNKSFINKTKLTVFIPWLFSIKQTVINAE